MAVKTRAVICRLDEPLYQRLEERAAREDRYPAQQVIHLLRQQLSEDDTATPRLVGAGAG